MSGPSARIVLIADHPLGLDALRRGLQEIPGAVVIAVVSTAEEACRLTILGEAAVALIDVALPDMSGIQLVRVFRGSHPMLRCLMISAQARRSHVLDALAAGAWGFVMSGDGVELNQAVQSVLAGHVYLSRILRGSAS